MDNINISYRQLHERFMQNHTGTTLEDSISIQTPLPVTIFLSVYIANNIIKYGIPENKTKCNYVYIYLTEFFILVVLQILLYTLPEFNLDISFYLYISGLFFTAKVILNYLIESIAQKTSTVALRKTELSGKRPYITYYRTCVILTTTICILAVDFTVFPRSLTKTETYGFSLMDTGVGYFVVCNALVGIHPDKLNARANRPILVLLLIRKNLPLLALGLIRFITVNSVNYQQHTSEYGVHWNFFITLALTKIIATLILTFFNKSDVKYLALGTVLIHQISLSCGIEQWVLSDLPRDTFLLANREGLSSLLGYVTLYLVAVEVGNRLNAKRSSFERDVKCLAELIFYTLVFYIAVQIFNIFFQCSRRLANITYIAWIIVLTLYLLFWCLLFEIILRLNNGHDRLKDANNLVPGILMSINLNPLPYFLGANLLTGLINVCIKTIYIPKISSIVIITLYMFVNCSCVSILKVKNIKLPF